MDFVVNEWLPEYFRPNATKEEKKKLEKFLNTFIAKNDRIFVRSSSEFLRKILRYAKDYQANTKVYSEINKFIKIVLKDSEKCCLINDDDFTISDEIINKLEDGGNMVSDKYLFEAASATESKLIVTTDVKLINHLNSDKIYRVISLDDFLVNYMKTEK